MFGEKRFSKLGGAEFVIPADFNVLKETTSKWNNCKSVPLVLPLLPRCGTCSSPHLLPADAHGDDNCAPGRRCCPV